MPPDSLARVAQTGDLRATLECLRDLLARKLDACDSSRDAAALSKQLQDVLAQLQALPPPVEKTSTLAQITQARAARQSGANGEAIATS